MLKFLKIKNYALIEELEAEFNPGLNIMTGETGAGKSIIVGALGLVLGGRSSFSDIREGTDKAVVEAVFDISEANSDKLRKEIALLGIDIDEDNLIVVKREIQKDGKTKNYINSSLSSLSGLKNLSGFMVDIHSQYDQQSLLKPEKYIELLDGFGRIDKEVTGFGNMYNRYKSLHEQLEQILNNEEEATRQIDFLRYQLDELEKASFNEDEDIELERERDIIKNSEQLFQLISDTSMHLDEQDGSILERIDKIAANLREVSGIDKEINASAEECENIKLQLSEISREIKKYKDKLHFEPNRLLEIEDRLALFNDLKRKYRCQNLKELKILRNKIKNDLENIGSGDERKEKLKEELSCLKSEALKKAGEISQKRKKIAVKLGKNIENELHQLGMNKARFSVNVRTEKDIAKYSEKGSDEVIFLFSPNVGESLKPLKMIASGGELSRVMLALKTIFSKVDDIPILIFDEIDTNIGGRLGDVIGTKLDKIAFDRQVVCITHLPQIASHGLNHYKVDKYVKNRRTFTCINRLNSKERIEEVANMLAGKELSDITRRHAKEMLEKYTG
jgi:DNA repair protein RecN (Recombination protein N)